METVVKLQRLEMTDAGTFGEIDCLGVKFVTGELPWNSNKVGESCIPPGTYKCVWAFSPKFQAHKYLIKDVPGRTAIRFHSANFVANKNTPGLRSQVDGCIALGTHVGFIDKQQALINSIESTRHFENRLKNQPFTLEIVQPWAALYPSRPGDN